MKTLIIIGSICLYILIGRILYTININKEKIKELNSETELAVVSAMWPVTIILWILFNLGDFISYLIIPKKNKKS